MRAPCTPVNAMFELCAAEVLARHMDSAWWYGHASLPRTAPLSTAAPACGFAASATYPLGPRLHAAPGLQVRDLHGETGIPSLRKVPARVSALWPLSQSRIGTFMLPAEKAAHGSNGRRVGKFMSAIQAFLAPSIVGKRGQGA